MRGGRDRRTTVIVLRLLYVDDDAADDRENIGRKYLIQFYYNLPVAEN